ncbi:glycosyltransferase family 2 protein [Ruegeria hyattellae]|uniref:glycosyltransferase family 2 protein n=1 Tax=Ruegeria hyattellae TaxID=3233337 RepID=UPI00355C6C32
MPCFSIIVPCFNAEATIVETLDSLSEQTLPDFEIICVDDGSTDATCALILAAQKQDSRISLARNTGKGPSDARNLGALTLAQGEIIAFCDADDLWATSKLAYLNVAFRSSSVDAAYSQVAFFDACPEKATTYSEVPESDLKVSHLLGENPVCTMSNLAVRREVFADTGGFDAQIVHNEDLEWLIRLVGQGARVVSIADALTYYRRNHGGLSADLPAMAKGRDAALKTAARFGFHPSKKDEAVHMRYLARRALRLGYGRLGAVRFAMRGLLFSPVGFFAQPRRGALTLFGALVALVLPRRVNHLLFSR